MGAEVVGTPTTGASASGTSITIATPSGILDGDLLVAVIRGQDSAGTTDFALAGWTRRGPAFVASNVIARIMGIYTKPILDATVEPGSYTFNHTGASGRIAGSIFIVRGADLDDPIQVNSPDYFTTTVTNGTRLPSLTATAPGLLIGLAANEVVSPNSSTPTFPSGTTPIVTAPSSAGTGSSRTVAVAYYEILSGAGATGNKDTVWLSSSSASSHGIIINNVPPPGDALARVYNGTSEEAANVSVWNGTSEDPASVIIALPSAFQRYTVSDMQDAFDNDETVYWAHRGGSLDWGEMTMRAYTNAIFHGCRALEYSAQFSQDGVFVGMHDATLDRVTALTGDVADYDWSELEGVAVDGGGTISRLEYILETYGRSHVLVIEDKTYLHYTEMIALIESLIPDPQEHVVIKAHGAGGSYPATAAQAAGYKTWGYFSDTDLATMAAKQVNYDYLGFNYNASGGDWTTALGYGKPVVAFVVPDEANATAALGKGANGLQCASVTTIVPAQNPEL